MACHTGGVCLNCVTGGRRYAAAAVRRPQARPGPVVRGSVIHSTVIHDTVIHDTVFHDTVFHDTVIHDTAVKANVPSGPAANGRASITASTLSGP